MDSTVAVPGARQFEWFRETVSATHLPWDLPANRHQRFVAAVRERALGAASMVACECDPCTGRRGPTELARTPRAMFGVLFVGSGRERIRHTRGDVELGANTFTLWDSTAPLQFDVPGTLCKVTLLVPAEVFTAAIEQPHRYIGRAFDASTGCAALILAQLVALDRLSSQLAPPQQDAALRSTLELLGAAVGDGTDGAASLVDEIVRHARTRLADPELDPDAIADALGMSRRRLDRAFATTGSSVTRWIWRERAERCRRDMLLEPRANLLELAVRWGFNEASHFTRVFRREFGCTPHAYRRRLLAPR